MKNLKIEKPSVLEVERYLKIWDESPEFEKFRHQEKSVIMLFREQYPKNTKIEEVLIKVSVLNDFYRTNIRDTYSVARNIVNQDIDSMLANADTGIVNKVARVTIKKKERCFYSFATKYCTHHRPDDYPIYDSFVDKMLRYFKNEEKFYNFKNEELKCYESFKKIIFEFKKYYKLDKFTLRQLDFYLWILGREKYPQKYNDAKLKNE